MTRWTLRSVALSGLLLATASLQAHHSLAGAYALGKEAKVTGTYVTVISSPTWRAFGPVLPIPSLARLVTLPPVIAHSVAVPSAFLTSSFNDECGFTSLNAVNAPVTFASFPNAYAPARE